MMHIKSSRENSRLARAIGLISSPHSPWVKVCCLTLLCGLPTLAANAQSKPIAYRGARILTAAKQDFDPGCLVIHQGRIVAVGSVPDIKIPQGATVVDVSGKVIIPGLVDTHSHLGVASRPLVSANSDGNESTGPVQSIVRALDSLNPFDPGIRMANAGGVTTANIMPGSSNVIGGQTIYVKLRGKTPHRMHIESPDVFGGLKMANGENPKRYGSRGQAPGTRMKVAALQRSEYVKAIDYRAKWDRHRKKIAAGEKDPPPDRDLSLEPLVEVLNRKRTVHFHTHRADDILTVLRLKREFGFDLVIQHGTEAFKVVNEIAKHKVPVSMTIVDSPGGKAEVVDFIEECGAEMARLGIPVLVNTDDPVTESRFFLRTTAIPVRGGLDPRLALRAITIEGAKAMRLQHRVGSLEVGKDADFAVLSGAPFSIYTRVLQTFIDGQSVFDLNDASQRLYQTGGFQVADKSLLPPPKPHVQPLPSVKAPTLPVGRKAALPNTADVVVLAGRLHTVGKGTLIDAAVTIKNGRIVRVGKRQDVVIPDGAKVLTAAVVTPGLIDTHSSVPLAGEYNITADQDQDETSDPNQADLRVIDAFHPGEPLLRFLLEQGVTVIHSCPGRKNVIGGMTGVFRTHGNSAETMTVKFPHAMLFNLGESPKTTNDQKEPNTRMKTAAMIRAALTSAANYKQSRAVDPNKPRDLKLDALTEVLDGKAQAMFCGQRADDLLTSLRLIREFKLKGTLALAAEGYMIRDELKAAGVPVIVHPTMQRVGGLETINSILNNASALSDGGIRIAIGSGFEGYVPKSRVIRHEAAIAMIHGLGFDKALSAVTLDAARVLGIEKDHGSIEAGKVADLVLYDGDPFEHITHVTHVLVDGKVVHDRAARAVIPIAQRLQFLTPAVFCCLGF